MLIPFEQAFNHTSRFNSLVYFLYFFSYLSSSFNNPCHFPGLHLDYRLEGPKKALGELDICYSLSSFYQADQKMTDFDVDPFGEHNKMDTQPDETGESIPLTQEE